MGPSGIGKVDVASHLPRWSRSGRTTARCDRRAELTRMSGDALAISPTGTSALCFQFHHLLPGSHCGRNVAMPGWIGRIPLEEGGCELHQGFLRRLRSCRTRSSLPEPAPAARRQRVVAIARARFFRSPSSSLADGALATSISPTKVFDLMQECHVRERRISPQSSLPITRSWRARCDRVLFEDEASRPYGDMFENNAEARRALNYARYEASKLARASSRLEHIPFLESCAKGKRSRRFSPFQRQRPSRSTHTQSRRRAFAPVVDRISSSAELPLSEESKKIPGLRRPRGGSMPATSVRRHREHLLRSASLPRQIIDSSEDP